MKELVHFLQKIKSNTLNNYVLAGLSSSLIGEKSKIRMFEASRETYHFITPHNHKFDFCCLVLQGTVENIVYETDDNGDEWAVFNQTGELGNYNSKFYTVVKFKATSNTYTVGQLYNMEHHQFHSIKFSKDAIVLFFEGVSYTNKSQYLEPYSNGVCDTFQTKEWMFKKDVDSIGKLD